MNTPAALCLIALTSALTPAATAQTVVVDYDDGALGNPPILTFPFYNVGTSACRWQSFVPSSFRDLPKTPMFVSRIGLQVSGAQTYRQFEIRAGANTFATLDQTWATNLPDQRIQKDLSGIRIEGGATTNGARTNKWVEFDLDHPFVWAPGQNVVLDLTTNVSIPGAFLYSARGTTDIPRLVDFMYAGGTAAPNGPQAGGGLKIRLVFEPLTNIVHFGNGCAGTGNKTPSLTAFGGGPKVGNQSFFIELANARANAIDGLAFGLNKYKTPLDFGGRGCAWYTTSDIVLLGRTSAMGTDSKFVPIPNNLALVGATVHCQWGVVDAAAGSTTGWALSNGGSIVVFK